VTKKQARQICREKAAEAGGMWPMCWDKQNGYYPAAGKGQGNKHIAYVDKNGCYLYVTKENAKKHNL
jgi:hypothetical protein